MAADPSDRLDVLLVEDNPGDARLVEHSLRTGTGGAFEPPELVQAESMAAAVEELEAGEYDLVLLDLGLPERSGLDTLERLQDYMEERDEPVPVVVLTGFDDREAPLEAIQAGAQDYLLKGDLDGDALERSIRYAMERHRQERELQRQNERLERFASVVSHDLRNPLSSAQGTARMLMSRADEEDREQYERLLECHDRMADIIDDVLTLARQGQSVDETTPVDLATVADDCWETVGAGEATIVVEADGVIEADAGRLRQLFENLFRNAVEHGASSRPESDDTAEHDSESVTVTVGDLDGGFYVADDGAGVPEGERESVFEAGHTANEEGTGLGLNIVRDIAEAHGWTVTLTESETGGARFEFRGVTSS
jgi:signal transduction histidine kinase